MYLKRSSLSAAAGCDACRCANALAVSATMHVVAARNLEVVINPLRR